MGRDEIFLLEEELGQLTVKSLLVVRGYNLTLLCLGINECNGILTDIRDMSEDELLYSLAFKTESNLLGKESLKFDLFTKKLMKQCSYISVSDVVDGVDSKFCKDGSTTQVSTAVHQLEEEMGSEEFLAELETNVLVHNLRDYGDFRVPPFKEAKLQQMDHDGLMTAAERLNMETDGCQSGFVRAMEGKSQKGKKVRRER
ncbi:hypothetical protein Goari_004169 [Gossypium aridum]|uniref:Uncharacterized protein n=1 Tax=Gossypium aridum TaxID=34290 RepID=A0A7J8Y334_GOSAI|nr:hypothetical protein [Gossypium aridum]